ncbi:hypothetical protein LWI28_007732 [Acer negundo]|uniref:Uncharacterized protein n=1 Tax=Acer negundo TaxID=4023 RepID=A0AAD5I5E2_ACENE|nr:hypothetical protein LWI28_007732 [Acer negundo]
MSCNSLNRIPSAILSGGIQNFQNTCAIKIRNNGFSSFQDKRARQGEGDPIGSQQMDTGKQLALLVTCTLRIALSERKEPWSSIMVELQTEKKTEWKMNEYKALDGEASSATGAGPPVRFN